MEESGARAEAQSGLPSGSLTAVPNVTTGFLSDVFSNLHVI